MGVLKWQSVGSEQQTETTFHYLFPNLRWPERWVENNESGVNGQISIDGFVRQSLENIKYSFNTTPESTNSQLLLSQAMCRSFSFKRTL